MQGNKYLLFVFGFALFLLGSCKPKELDTTAYLNWMSDTENGLHVIKKSGDFTCDVQYKTASYIAGKESLSKKDKKAFFDKRIKQLAGMDYLELRLTSESGDFIKAGVESPNEYNDHLYYYSFNFQNDLKLLSGKEELPCEMYHFERSYDLKKERRFLLGFPKKEGIGDKVLIIDSPVLGAGIIRIKLAKESFENIPKIKI